MYIIYIIIINIYINFKYNNKINIFINNYIYSNQKNQINHGFFCQKTEQP